MFKPSSFLAFFICVAFTTAACRENEKNKPTKNTIALEVSDTASIDSVLTEAYRDNQVIYLSHGDHMSPQHLQVLERALELFGQNEELVAVVLERHHDAQDLFDSVVQEGLDPTLSQMAEFHRQHPTIPDQDPEIKDLKKKALSYFNTVCIAAEWSYTLTDTASKIRRLNTMRKSPLRILAVDSMSKTKWTDWPILNLNTPSLMKNRVQGCEKFNLGSFSTSLQREQQTAQKFEEIYKNLAHNQKILVVYHQAHLVRETDLCLTDFSDGFDVIKQARTTLTWRQAFEQRHPEARRRSATIFIDSNSYEGRREAFTEKSKASFTFIDHYLQSHGTQEFAVSKSSLQKFKGSSYLNYMVPGSNFRNMQSHYFPESHSTLADQFDAIIYKPTSPSASYLNYKWPSKLHEVCEPLFSRGWASFAVCRNELCPGDGTP